MCVCVWFKYEAFFLLAVCLDGTCLPRGRYFTSGIRAGGGESELKEEAGE